MALLLALSRIHNVQKITIATTFIFLLIPSIEIVFASLNDDSNLFEGLLPNPNSNSSADTTSDPNTSDPIDPATSDPATSDAATSDAATIDPGTIDADTIKDNSVTSNKIKDGAVKSQDIADAAITSQKLAPDMQLRLIVTPHTSDSGKIAGYRQGHAIAYCSANELVSGGGFIKKNDDADLGFYINGPVRTDKGHGWQVSAWNTNPRGINNDGFTVYVMCIKMGSSVGDKYGIDFSKIDFSKLSDALK